MRDLEEELTTETDLMSKGKDQQKHAELAKKVQAKLNEGRSRIARLEMERRLLSRKLEECSKDIEVAKLGPTPAQEKMVKFAADTGKSSKKSKK